MNTLTLAMLLIGAGVTLAVLEVFLPSGGLLGLLSAACFVGGIVCAWSYSGRWGIATLIASLILIPVVVAMGFWMLPRTPIGRRMILAPPSWDSARQGPNEAAPAPPKAWEDLRVGMTGRAETDLRPSGTGVFNDYQRVSVVTAGEWIARSTPVRIVQIEGNRVVVERIDA